ncbi:MAG: hypothetical protein IPN60_15795 [Saprospiraceae bacterium]|nr:hypothetical protein [Candidatus Opimibacter skivensis]
MRWIPVINTPAKFGKCAFDVDKEGKTQCYVLEYVPAVSGILTSYTAGFFVSCTSLGSAISDNQSCAMSSNIRLFNGCSTVGQILMSSSGNTGLAINNQIEAGVPVIIHQVCLTILSVNQSLSMKIRVLDLTTSVDILGGGFATEYPTYEKAVFHRKRLDDDLLSDFLDFVGTPAGHLISKLDWSTTPSNKSSDFR